MYIFVAPPTCTTTTITLKPCALNAEFQHFILRFNKISLLCIYRGLRVKAGPKTGWSQGDFMDNSIYQKTNLPTKKDKVNLVMDFRWDASQMQFIHFWNEPNFIGQLLQRNETMETPQNRKFYFEVLSSSHLIFRVVFIHNYINGLFHSSFFSHFHLWQLHLFLSPIWGFSIFVLVRLLMSQHFHLWEKKIILVCPFNLIFYFFFLLVSFSISHFFLLLLGFWLSFF